MNSSANKCKEPIWRGFHTNPCNRTATIFERGEWWCKTHAPSAKEARRKKSNERVQRSLDEQAKASARRRAERAVIAEAKNWVREIDSVRVFGLAKLADKNAAENALISSVLVLIALEKEDTPNV